MTKDGNNTYASLTIDSISGGGYSVRLWPINPSQYSDLIFACSTKAELLKFIAANLLTTDVSLP